MMRYRVPGGVHVPTLAEACAASIVAKSKMFATVTAAVACFNISYSSLACLESTRITGMDCSVTSSVSEQILKRN